MTDKDIYKLCKELEDDGGSGMHACVCMYAGRGGKTTSLETAIENQDGVIHAYYVFCKVEC